MTLLLTSEEHLNSLALNIWYSLERLNLLPDSHKFPQNPYYGKRVTRLEATRTKDALHFVVEVEEGVEPLVFEGELPASLLSRGEQKAAEWLLSCAD